MAVRRPETRWDVAGVCLGAAAGVAIGAAIMAYAQQPEPPANPRTYVCDVWSESDGETWRASVELSEAVYSGK